jgi:polysaccharide biosynthesis protein PslH
VSPVKILWIYPELPYPLTSGYLRGYYLLRELGQCHEITFLCLTHRFPVPEESFSALKPYTKQSLVFSTGLASQPVWLKLVRATPFLGWRLRERWNTHWAIRQMDRELRRLLRTESFDVIHFSGRETLPLWHDLTLPVIVDCGDTHCDLILQQIRHVPLLQRLRLLLRYRRVRRLELNLARRTSRRYFISVRDRENLLGPGDNSMVVPQGVDFSYWKRTSPCMMNNGYIVFSGVMNYAPNADAALFLMRDILPLVKQRVPGVKVFIVGRDPTAELLRAARNLPEVEVTGGVRDVRPYLERATVYVAPLRFACGVQNKVLEAMSMEVPVITTPVVAAGLCVAGTTPPLVIRESAEEIANGIVQLLSNSTERERYSRRGRWFVESHCSWLQCAERLNSMFLATKTDPAYINAAA